MTGDLLHACDNCGTPCLLLAHTVKGWLGHCCYRRLGQPAPAPTKRTYYEAVQLAHAAMLRRGGDTAHKVRAGKA